MTEPKPLSKKHQRFVAEYLKCFNGTRAYMAVYKKASYESARANAARLLTIDSISKVIDSAKNSVLMQADEALKLQADIARGDMGDFLSIGSMGFTLDLEAAREEGKTKLIKKVKQKTTTFISKKPSDEDREIVETEIELYPADVAQERILKVHEKLKPDAGTVKVVIEYTDGNKT